MGCWGASDGAKLKSLLGAPHSGIDPTKLDQDSAKAVHKSIFPSSDAQILPCCAEQKPARSARCRPWVVIERVSATASSLLLFHTWSHKLQEVPLQRLLQKARALRTFLAKVAASAPQAMTLRTLNLSQARASTSLKWAQNHSR